MSLSITRLLNDARTRLPGATDGLVQQELFAAMDEFFKGSNVWQNDLSVPIVANQAAYELEADDPGIINRLMWMVNSNTQPVFGTMQVPGTIVLNTTPSTTDTYIVTVALTVTDPVPKSSNVPQCPDWIADKYRDVFLDGLVSRLCAMPAKPFSNEKLALFHGRRFRNGMRLAWTEAQHRNLFRGQGWVFPQGFAGGRQRSGTSAR